MANAAKLMKEKKKRQLEALLKNKGVPPVVEIIDEEIDDTAGMITNVTILDDEIQYDEATLNGMKKEELVALAESLGIESDGKKAELIEKILNA